MAGGGVNARRSVPSTDEVRALLESTGALTTGHFQLSSGLHSPAYVQCARLTEDPSVGRRVGAAMARRVASLRPASILAPAMGGLLIGYDVAAGLGLPFRFSERKDGAMTLRRGFAFEPGERVVIVEDVVTTGKSTKETARLVEEAGARVVAVTSIIDRTGGAGGNSPFDVPFFPLVTLDFPTHEPTDCPMCADGVAVSKPGSRPRRTG